MRGFRRRSESRVEASMIRDAWGKASEGDEGIEAIPKTEMKMRNSDLEGSVRVRLDIH